LLIYVVIKARTPYLASNLAYIERYRYHPKLTAEAQYYYIQLVRARGGGGGLTVDAEWGSDTP